MNILDRVRQRFDYAAAATDTTDKRPPSVSSVSAPLARLPALPSRLHRRMSLLAYRWRIEDVVLQRLLVDAHVDPCKWVCGVLRDEQTHTSEHFSREGRG
jgi:hypothetical protein